MLLISQSAGVLANYREVVRRDLFGQGCYFAFRYPVVRVRENLPRRSPRDDLQPIRVLDSDVR
jgi:hypothetical protein